MTINDLFDKNKIDLHDLADYHADEIGEIVFKYHNVDMFHLDYRPTVRGRLERHHYVGIGNGAYLRSKIEYVD